ncbi:MAG: DUF6602 domain-containing protein [Candidatus Edwardsbacteria bacterium]
MARKKQTTGISAYYSAIQKIFNLESEVLTGVLPHYGERGKNDEERLKDFLTKVLPHKFGIGTGFIVCSEPSKPVSNQTDIVIFDQLLNSPLYRELSSDVYPIEMVYATVEVKGVLQKKDIKKTLESIGKIRNLTKNKKYVEYGSVPKSPENKDQRVVSVSEYHVDLSPRAFLFAYTKRGWRTLENFNDFLTQSLFEFKDAHLHGIIVLEKDWFLYQEAYPKEGVEFHCHDNNSLLRFTNKMLHDIQSFPMGIMLIDAYFKEFLSNKQIQRMRG